MYSITIHFITTVARYFLSALAHSTTTYKCFQLKSKIPIDSANTMHEIFFSVILYDDYFWWDIYLKWLSKKWMISILWGKLKTLQYDHNRCESRVLFSSLLKIEVLDRLNPPKLCTVPYWRSILCTGRTEDENAKRRKCSIRF